MLIYIKKKLKNWLGVRAVEGRIMTLEKLLFDEEALLNGFARLKKRTHNNSGRRKSHER